MPNYDLDRLGDSHFEHIAQALLKKVIGGGTITFGDGPDGGREATFSGAAAYPSREEQWSGEWVFQAKFHNTRAIGPDKARKALVADLKTELSRIVPRRIDNYILLTNVPLTSVADSGTHDRISQEVVPEFAHAIKHIHVWGYDDICRFLDDSPAIRQTYLHLITPGDLIAELIQQVAEHRSTLAETVHLYVRTCFENEQNAQLDQAGELNERPTLLRRIFIDLFAKPRSDKDFAALADSSAVAVRRLHFEGQDQRLSVVRSLVMDDLPRCVLIGGPGQGKSTLGQYIGQIHRAYLLGKSSELGDGGNVVPAVVRVPFRMILKDFAQWISDSQRPVTVEAYLLALIEERAGRGITATQLHDAIKTNPVLLILDGLDEVTDRTLRSRMMKLLSEFIGRCQDILKANIQIVATSRPTGYSDQFDPGVFLHLALLELDRNKVRDYTERWISAKGLEPDKSRFLRAAISDCSADENFSALMTTPLQVTIFILIILSGGTPPRQREELFNEYLEVIYKREKSKSKTIIQTEKRLLFGLHQYLGYHLQLRAEGGTDVRAQVTQEEFIVEVIRYLRYDDPYSPEATLREKAEQMLSEAQERLVLIVGLASGFVGFELRSIQEFFAAGYLTDRAQDAQQRFARFRAIALLHHWHNTALFFAGRVGRCFPGEAAQVLEVCRALDRELPDRYLRRGAWLALEIAADKAFGPDRMLQRSAIEHGLTVLDTDLDTEALHQAIELIRKLPSEDLAQHVSPLFDERLHRVQLPEALASYHAARSTSGPVRAVEAALSNSLRKGRISAAEFLNHAVGLRLTPGFIGTHVRRARLPADSVLAVVEPLMFGEGGYALSVLRESGHGWEIAQRMFDECLDKWPGRSFGELGSLRQLLSSDEFDQLVLASELICASISSAFPRGDSDRDRIADLDEETLLEIVQNEQYLDELRGAALGALALFAFRSGEWRHWIAGAETLAVADEPTRELVERILFRSSAPALDMRDHIAVTVSRLRSSRSPGGRASAFAFLFDACTSARLESAWDKLSGTRGRRAFAPGPARLLIRVEDFGFEMRALPPAMISVGLENVTEILRQNGPDQWRGWILLQRMCALEWKTKEATQEGQAIIAAALNGLCDVLEQRGPRSLIRGEIAALAVRAAEVKLKEQALRCLGVIAAGATTPAHRLQLLWLMTGPVPSGSSVLQLWEAGRSNDSGEAGFLRAFELFLRRDGHYQPRGLKESHLKLRGIPYPPVKLTKALKGADEVSHRGALGVFALCRRPNTREALKVLAHDCSIIGEAEPVRLLIEHTARSLEPAEASQFLERLLDRAEGYSRIVRQGALRQYGTVRLQRSGIRRQEADLGLPFQTGRRSESLPRRN